jgi:hypothetical protein
VAELAEFCSLGGRGPVIVGTPERVADELELWMEETGLDGFNLCFALMPESFEDMAELLIPELQRRGRFKREYRPGTYREKLFSRGPHLPPGHRGAGFRRTA